MANYLDVPSGSGAGTPNQAPLASGTTPIDVRIEIQPASWASGYQVPIDYDGSAGSDRWALFLTPSGELEWTFSSTGAVIDQVSTVATGFSANTSHGVRALHNVAAGTLDFYTSPDFSSWTPLGTQITGLATTTMKTSGANSSIHVGRDWNNTYPNPGRVTKVQVIINSVTILNWDITTATPGGGPWTATSGETWTAIGTASVIGAAGPTLQELALTGVGT